MEGYVNKKELVPSISEQRLNALLSAVEKMKRLFSPDELASIKAIIVFGSIASGYSSEDSDVDMWVVSDTDKALELQTYKKVSDIMKDSLPNVEFQIATSSLELKSNASRHIVRRSYRHPERLAKWKFIYFRDDNARVDLDAILETTQRLLENKQQNQEFSKADN